MRKACIRMCPPIGHSSGDQGSSLPERSEDSIEFALNFFCLGKKQGEHLSTDFILCCQVCPLTPSYLDSAHMSARWVPVAVALRTKSRG